MYIIVTSKQLEELSNYKNHSSYLCRLSAYKLFSFLPPLCVSSTKQHYLRCIPARAFSSLEKCDATTSNKLKTIGEEPTISWLLKLARWNCLWICSCIFTWKIPIKKIYIFTLVNKAIDLNKYSTSVRGMVCNECSE